MTNLATTLMANYKHTVLAASSTDPAAGHCPILLFTNETFLDFNLTTRLKIVGGTTAPEAGIAFRVQDEKNYYVMRASTVGNEAVHGSLLWYRVVGGVRYESQGKGVLVPIPPDTWQELRVECVGNTIRGFLNGKQLIPPVLAGSPTNDAALPRINDTTFAAGKTGFWTAADTSARFADTRIEYSARVPQIQTVIAAVMKKNDRLLGLKVYALRRTPRPRWSWPTARAKTSDRPAARPRRSASPRARPSVSGSPTTRRLHSLCATATEMSWPPSKPG